ncbi:uncharacterized protein TRIADDRAFT_1010, partial [Trichoplax adhaerens]
IKFDNYRIAYKDKTPLELLRGVLVYRSLTIDYLVDNAIWIMKKSRSLLGRTLFDKLMRATIYGQFVAGENRTEIMTKIHKMADCGVSPILDYATEEDITRNQPSVYLNIFNSYRFYIYFYSTTTVSTRVPVETQFQADERFADRRENVICARTYFYEGERKCDENLETFMRCIETAKGMGRRPLIAVKVTALGEPRLLLQLSATLNQTESLFNLIAIQADDAMDRCITLESFKKALDKLQMPLTNEQATEVFSWIDINETGCVPIDWGRALQPHMKVTNFFSKLKDATGKPLFVPLEEEDLIQWKKVVHRLQALVECAIHRNVTLMVDAEQTYFQPAISCLTKDLQKVYNKEKGYVFNTYQCYLKNTPCALATDLAEAKRENYIFGVKLVRGAYMDQERLRAETLGYEDPVQPNIESTTQCYNKMLTMIMNNIKNSEIIVASHNEGTVKFAIEKMKELDIRKDENKVLFGQLYGMCDRITYALGAAGYCAYKLVPYGPVDEVLPYLTRRALENRGFVSGATRERELMWKEFKHRYFS